MKGTVEHGTILGAVDEIVLTLDDNSMNLQSMSASRYVGPFLEKVQKWEKSLSHISEVVEVCCEVELCAGNLEYAPALPFYCTCLYMSPPSVTMCLYSIMLTFWAGKNVNLYIIHL